MKVRSIQACTLRMAKAADVLECFWPDNSKLAATSQAGENWVWDLTGAEPKELAKFDGPARLAGTGSLILSDGKRVLSLVGDQCATFDIRTFPPPKEPMHSLRQIGEYAGFAAGGRHFFVGRLDGVVQAWQESEKEVARVPLAGPERPFGHLVSLSPDGRWLAGGVCPPDGVYASLRLWSLTGAAPKLTPLPADMIIGD